MLELHRKTFPARLSPLSWKEVERVGKCWKVLESFGKSRKVLESFDCWKFPNGKSWKPLASVGKFCVGFTMKKLSKTFQHFPVLSIWKFPATPLSKTFQHFPALANSFQLFPRKVGKVYFPGLCSAATIFGEAPVLGRGTSLLCSPFSCA